MTDNQVIDSAKTWIARHFKGQVTVGNILSIASALSTLIILFSDLRRDVSVIEVKIDDNRARTEEVRRDMNDIQSRILYLERRERQAQREEQQSDGQLLIPPFYAPPDSPILPPLTLPVEALNDNGH